MPGMIPTSATAFQVPALMTIGSTIASTKEKNT